MDFDEDVVAETIEVVAIAEVESLLGGQEGTPSTPPRPFRAGEVAFAFSVSDPARRLAARLAAKRAAARALGGGIGPEDVEVVRRPGGAPELRFSSAAATLLKERGVDRALVSLTHGRTHAAAAVILVR